MSEQKRDSVESGDGINPGDNYQSTYLEEQPTDDDAGYQEVEAQRTMQPISWVAGGATVINLVLATGPFR